MGKYNFNSLLLQVTDSINRLFCFLFIGMNTANMTVRVQPLANLSLLAHDPSIVTCVARQIDLSSGIESYQQVDMPW